MTPKHPPPSVETSATDPAHGAAPPWPALSRRDWAPILIAVAIPTIIAITRLPPGVCFGDSGDLQLSSVTLGIGHPPGYPILSTVGYVLTRIPFVEPAYIITIACVLCGAIAACLCGLVQIRLGAHPMIAAGTAAIFLAHPRVWFNVVAPEVYMPSLAMLMGSVYCFAGFAANGSRRHFFVATLLFGATLFTRPPTLFSLPFFFLATILIDKSRKIPGGETRKRILLGAFLITLPGLYSFGFILARDRGDVAYNYIDLHNAESGALPDATSGLAARVERAVWTMTGQQYAEKLGTRWPKIRSQLNFLRNRAFPVESLTLILILVIAAGGMFVSWYRDRCATIVLTGFGIQTIVFLCVYQVHGQEANLLPLLAATTIFVGVAVSETLARFARPRRMAVAGAIAILAVGSTTAYLFRRPDIRGFFDATDALARVDLATLPANSVIISAWGMTTPLRYAHFYANRPDIHIETVSPSRWPEFARKFRGRPVFVPRVDEQIQSLFRTTAYRNLHLLDPRERD